MFNKLLIILWLASTVLAADSWRARYGIGVEWQSKQRATIVYSKSGTQYVERRGQYKKPTLIVDTVRFAGQFYQMPLQSRNYRGQMRVAATDKSRIHVLGINQIVTDSSKSVYNYHLKVNRTGDTVTVTSSNANDSSLVEVVLMVQ